MNLQIQNFIETNRYKRLGEIEKDFLELTSQITNLDNIIKIGLCPACNGAIKDHLKNYADNSVDCIFAEGEENYIAIRCCELDSPLARAMGLIK